jgi:cobalt-zinc-cadmium efflux system membrane fusion protein
MKSILYSFILISVLFFQCSEPAGEEQEHHEEGAEETHNENGVELSRVQVASAGLGYGTFDSLNISGFINANGILDLPPQNIAAVSAPMAGTVKKANKLVGNYVEKGTVLAVLEHPEYIKLQEEYLNQLTQLNFLQAEYERQRQLDSAAVTAKKQFQQVTANYRSAQARKQALEKQLLYLGLSPNWVAQGNITSSISLRAPISGYITQQNVHNGQFVTAEQEIYELVDNEHMHLELNIFEQDIFNVNVGQPIRFTVPSIGGEVYEGEVFLVGKSFDPDSKTVKVHGHIKGEHDKFIRGLYVEAKVYTGEQRVLALPEEAVVEDEGKSFIFILNPEAAEEHSEEAAHEHEEAEHAEEAHAEAGHGQEEAGHEHGITFQRVQVATGTKDQGYTTITELPRLPAGTRIVTRGAYYLLAEMKKGEGGHHH